MRDASTLEPRPVASGRATPSSEPPAVTEALRDLRARRLALPPPGEPTRSLAFGGGRLARALDDAVVLYDLPGGAEIARVPLEEPRALTRLADGSLFAVGRQASLRFARGSKRGDPTPKVTLFPRSTLFADLTSPERLWVLHDGDASLYQYEIDAASTPLLLPSRKIELPAFGGGPWTMLADGALVYASGAELVRVHPGGRAARLRLLEVLPSVERLLPDRRLDRVWALGGGGRLTLLQLEVERARVITTRELGGEPFDVAAAAGRIAAVYVERATRDSFRLSVLDPDGGVLTTGPERHGLAGAGPEWAASLTENLRPVLESDGDFVAVGGPNMLRLWELRKGAALVSKRLGEPAK
ncbi:MAG TPA: hypothetical protein VF989_08320 [Polyangiaceae bacterium]